MRIEGGLSVREGVVILADLHRTALIDGGEIMSRIAPDEMHIIAGQNKTSAHREFMGRIEPIASHAREHSILGKKQASGEMGKVLSDYGITGEVVFPSRGIDGQPVLTIFPVSGSKILDSRMASIVDAADYNAGVQYVGEEKLGSLKEFTVSTIFRIGVHLKRGAVRYSIYPMGYNHTESGTVNSYSSLFLHRMDGHLRELGVSSGIDSMIFTRESQEKIEAIKQAARPR